MGRRRSNRSVVLSGLIGMVLALAVLVSAVLTPAVQAAPRRPSASCAPRSPAVPRHQAWAPARHTLAPAGASSALICRYTGLNAQPRLRLTAGILIRDPGAVTQIVQRLDGLPAGPAGPVACPSDDLSQITVTLAYPGGRAVAVSVGLSGCGIVTNGAVDRTTAGVPGQTEPRFLAWLTGRLRRRFPNLDGAAAVARDRWTTEQPAVLGARVDAAVTWDGRELLVVGGAPVTHPRADLASGAAYDPGRARWRPIASAPWALSATAATAWSGHRLFVLAAADGGARAPAAAALYDPAENRWTVTSDAPTGPLMAPRAVRFGNQIVVAGLSPVTPGVVRSASYDLGSGTWTALDPALAVDHPTSDLQMVATPAGVLLWSLWSRTIPGVSSPASSGVDVRRLTTSRTWSDATAGWPQNHTVDDPTPAGSRLLLAAGQIWCGLCSHPAPVGEPGVSVDPFTLRRGALPHGPLDDLGPQIVWTGQAEVAIDEAGAESGSRVDVRPGDIAALDLRTHRWLRGARAPDALQASPVWADHRLLAFGVHGRLLVDGPPPGR